MPKTVDTRFQYGPLRWIDHEIRSSLAKESADTGIRILKTFEPMAMGSLRNMSKEVLERLESIPYIPRWP